MRKRDKHFERVGRSPVFARGVQLFPSPSPPYRRPSRAFSQILKVPVCKVPVCELLKTTERQRLSRGNFCLAASRCLSRPSGLAAFERKPLADVGKGPGTWESKCPPRHVMLSGIFEKCERSDLLQHSIQGSVNGGFQTEVRVFWQNEIPLPPFYLNLTFFLPQFYLFLTSFLPLFNLN